MSWEDELDDLARQRGPALVPTPDDSAEAFVSVIGVAVSRVGDVTFVLGSLLDAQDPSGSSDRVLWRAEADVLPMPFHVVELAGRRVGFWSMPSYTGDEPVRVLVADE